MLKLQCTKSGNGYLKLTFELILLEWVGQASLVKTGLGFRTSSSMHTPCVDPEILLEFERWKERSQKSHLGFKVGYNT